VDRNLVCTCCDCPFSSAFKHIDLGLVSRSVRPISSYASRHLPYFGLRASESPGKPHEKPVRAIEHFFFLKKKKGALLFGGLK